MVEREIGPVEPLPDLMVEHLKVMAASRACLRILMVEREIDGGLNSRAPTGPYGRAPKGDGGQSSLLTHPLQLTYLPLK